MTKTQKSLFSIPACVLAAILIYWIAGGEIERNPSFATSIVAGLIIGAAVFPVMVALLEIVEEEHKGDE